jgi:sporulation protein YlmC with PRC-barrel domain
MSKLVLSVLAAAALAVTVPAFAQKAPDAKATAPAAVKIPKDTFYKGTGPTQYLARAKLIGQKVMGADGQSIGEIEDLILGKDGKIDGYVMGVGGFLGVGEKKIGVRAGAVKSTTKDGKTVLSLPVATKEVLGALEPYNGQKSMVQKASDTVKDAAKKASDAAKGLVGKKEEPKKQ